MVASTQPNDSATSVTILSMSWSKSRMELIFWAAFCRCALNILLNIRICCVQRVGLRRQRQVHNRLRQREIPFWHADKIYGVTGGHAQRKCIWFSETDVLYSHSDNAAGNIERVFAGFEHSSQPIQ